MNTATLWRNALARLDTTPIDAVTQELVTRCSPYVNSPLANTNGMDENGALMLMLQFSNEQVCNVDANTLASCA